MKLEDPDGSITHLKVKQLTSNTRLKTIDHSTSCPEMEGQQTSRTSTHLPATKSVSCTHIPLRPSFKKASVEVPKEDLSPEALVIEADEAVDMIVARKATQSQPLEPAPAARARGHFSQYHSSESFGDSDPLAARMRRVLDQAYG